MGSLSTFLFLQSTRLSLGSQVSGRRAAVAGFAASGRTSALLWWCLWISSVWSRRCWFCLWIHPRLICLSGSCRPAPACPLLPGCSARHGAAGVNAMGGLRTPRSCSGCSCRSVCSSECFSPALWGQSSQQDERFLQGEGLWGDSTGSSAEVHVTLGILIGALLPQPWRKDASIYSREPGSPLALNCPLEATPPNRGQPWSVFRLQRGQHTASPGLCPLGRSCLRLRFAPALWDQGKAHSGTQAVQLPRRTEQILEGSMSVCCAPALQPEVGLTKPGHPSTTAQLCPTCVTAARVLPAPINEEAF